jgi:hypothetical protein
MRFGIRMLIYLLIARRMDLAENWRRRGKFEEVRFVFPNAANIPITMVRRNP